MSGDRTESRKEQIKRHGGLLRAAEEVAYSLAIATDGVEESAMSYPAIRVGEGGPALVFLHHPSGFDPERGDDVLHRAVAAIEVDARTLEPRVCELWEEAMEETAVLCGVLPPAAVALQPAHLLALDEELAQLYDPLLEIFAKESLSNSQGAKVKRFSTLVHFLVPEPVQTALREQAPDFFTWLEEHASGGDDSEAPEARGRGSAPLLPPRRELASLEEEMGAPHLWRLQPAALARALDDLSLVAAPRSPLADLSRDTAISPGCALSELVRGWPTEPWRGALETLANPQWEIYQVFADDDSAFFSQLYAGAGEDEALWVHHRRETESEVISFPQDPGRFREIIIENLSALNVRRAGPYLEVLSAGEMAVLFALADHAQLDRATRAPATALELQRICEAAPLAKEVSWAAAAHLASPAPLPITADAIAGALAALCEAGRLRLLDGIALPGPRLRVLLRVLGRPRAVSGLQVDQLLGAGGAAGDAISSGVGVALVRTENALWAWELVEDTEGSDSSTRLQLFQITGGQLADILSAMLGL